MAYLMPLSRNRYYSSNEICFSFSLFFFNHSIVRLKLLLHFFFPYLGILKTEFLSQLLTIRLADVLLYLKPLLKAAPLKIREHRPSHHSSTWFSTGVRRPWKYQASAGKVAETALNRTWERCPTTWGTRMMTPSSGTGNYTQFTIRLIVKFIPNRWKIDTYIIPISYCNTLHIF